MDGVELPPLVSELRNPVREHGIGPIWDAIFDWADGEEGSPATGLLADRINDAINEHMGDFARAAVLADRERRQPAPSGEPAGYMFRVLRGGKGRVDEFIAIDCVPNPSDTILSKTPLYTTPQPDAVAAMRQALVVLERGRTHAAVLGGSDSAVDDAIDALRAVLDGEKGR
jgi:hypothetical protein